MVMIPTTKSSWVVTILLGSLWWELAHRPSLLPELLPLCHSVATSSRGARRGQHQQYQHQHQQLTYK